MPIRVRDSAGSLAQTLLSGNRTDIPHRHVSGNSAQKIMSWRRLTIFAGTMFVSRGAARGACGVSIQAGP